MGGSTIDDSAGKLADGRTPRVTIADVAEALGVAKGTVSRALNGYPDISASTRQRVVAAARKMGYSPLAHAQAIRTGRVRAVGLVLQLEQHDAQKPFLADFLRGITRQASHEGWTLTVATAESEATGLATYRRLIDERKADGFILPRTRLDDPRIALLRAEQVPFVLFGRTGNPEACAWYDIASEDSMREAVRRLAAQGHRRIGFLGGNPAFTYAELRRAGFREGIEEAGLPRSPDLIAEGCTTEADARDAAARLLAVDEAPTALVCATDLLAVGAVRAARELGLVPGRTISVIGYDGSPDGAGMDPPLTTFEVDQLAAGTRLAALLIARVRGTAPESLRETAPATFRQGGTDGPPWTNHHREDR